MPAVTVDDVSSLPTIIVPDTAGSTLRPVLSRQTPVGPLN